MLPGLERHPHARAVLGGALPPAGRPSHAYLFQGPAGAGKASVARALAAELLADGAADREGARTRVDHGVHPDLTWVCPASAAGILVGDVDEAVVAAATRTPFEARRRVFVLEDADELNEQAANRLLKTLEEPPPFAHLVLLTSRPGDVLPTIASRCQVVRFDAPGVGELAARLGEQGVDERTADACARLSLGDADLALALATGEGRALRAAAEAFARAPLRGGLAARPWLDILRSAGAEGDRAQAAVERAAEAEAELVPRRERRRLAREAGERAKRAHRRATTAGLHASLRLAGLWYRDLACLADGAPELVHASDRLDALRDDAEGRSAQRLRAALEHVEDTRASLQLNPAEELALEALAFRLARELGSRATAPAR
jgi:DNA polymerase-3 subunit delta'